MRLRWLLFPLVFFGLVRHPLRRRSVTEIRLRQGEYYLSHVDYWDYDPDLPSNFQRSLNPDDFVCPTCHSEWYWVWKQETFPGRLTLRFTCYECGDLLEKQLFLPAEP